MEIKQCLGMNGSGGGEWDEFNVFYTYEIIFSSIVECYGDQCFVISS
jgi:hypothetical protein